MKQSDERLVPGAARSSAGALLLLRHIFAYEVALSRALAQMRIADVGCGDGYGTAMLAGCGSAITGFDVDQSAMSQAAEHYSTDRCSFVRFDGARLPLRSGSIDLVVSFQVIEHVPDDRAFTTELARVLRPGGELLLTTPNKATRLSGSGRPWNRFHRREYTADELEVVLGHSFAAVEVHGVTASGAALDVELNRLRRSRLIARLDPFQLRHKLPPSAAPMLIAAIARLRSMVSRAVDVPSREPLEAKRVFSLTTDVDATSLDLLAVCRAG